MNSPPSSGADCANCHDQDEVEGLSNDLKFMPFMSKELLELDSGSSQNRVNHLLRHVVSQSEVVKSQNCQSSPESKPENQFCGGPDFETRGLALQLMMIYARRSVIKIYARDSLAKYIHTLREYAKYALTPIDHTMGLIVSYALLFVRH